MKAGNVKQEAFIKEWEKSHKYDYAEARKALEKEGLLVCDGYEYGSGWQTQEVPDGVLRFLQTLPSASEPCAWNLLK